MSTAFFANSDLKVDPAVVDLLAEEMQAIERELCEQTASDIELVESICRHTLQAGGKRLRPALVTLCAAATGLPFERKRTRRLGACMEMIHMATLVHDDVIDHSATRRGVPTASSAFGSTEAVLCGDVLLAKAMRILALDGDLEAIENVSKVVVDLAEGEVYELELRGRIDVSEREHFKVLEKKTATFIQACCDLGGLCADAEPEIRAALRAYGFHLGIAFQLVDDLLDYRGDPERTGKPRASDFREGCATLPLIRLWPTLDDGERESVGSWFGEHASEDEIETVCAWMTERGAFDSCFGEASRHICAAEAALAPLNGRTEAELLGHVAAAVLSRTS